MTTWRDEPQVGARWWCDDPVPHAPVSALAKGDDTMAMHRKYAGWSELRPAPRSPWWREVLEMVAGVMLMGLALIAVAAGVLGLALMLG